MKVDLNKAKPAESETKIPPSKPPIEKMKSEQEFEQETDAQIESDVSDFLDEFNGIKSKKKEPEEEVLDEEDEEDEENLEEEEDEDNEEGEDEPEDEEEDTEEKDESEEDNSEESKPKQKKTESDLEEARKFILEQSEMILSQGRPPVEEPVEKVVETPPVQEIPEPGEFAVTEEEYNKAMESHEDFNTLMKKMYTQGQKVAQPIQDIESVINRRVSAMESERKFYENNPDLKHYDSVVTVVLRNLIAKSDGKENIEALLGQAEQVVRTQLRMPKEVKKKKKKQHAKPAKSGAKRRKVHDNRSSQESQMDEMMDIIL